MKDDSSDYAEASVVGKERFFFAEVNFGVKDLNLWPLVVAGKVSFIAANNKLRRNTNNIMAYLAFKVQV